MANPNTDPTAIDRRHHKLGNIIFYLCLIVGAPLAGSIKTESLSYDSYMAHLHYSIPVAIVELLVVLIVLVSFHGKRRRPAQSNQAPLTK